MLWRAILRKTHEILRRHINPTAVTSSVLHEDDVKQLAHIEREQGRLQAVDQLIYKLLKLQDQGWTNSFRIALKTQHPEVIGAVTKAGEDLLREDVFTRCVREDIFLQSKYIVSETITSAGGVLELQEFGVRLEIPAGALHGKEDISVSIVSSNDDHPPLGDNFILAPMVRLEPDGLQFLRPVTLTVTHSGVDLTLTNLQVWKKTGGKGMRAFEPFQCVYYYILQHSTFSQTVQIYKSREYIFLKE